MWMFLQDNDMWVGKGDAAFVDVIHVNSDALLCGGLSMPADLGDVDFYPNGGLHQPGCTDLGPIVSSLGSLATAGKNDLVMQSCSHNRGKFYFVESLNDGPGFVGTKCDSWEEFVNGTCDGNPQVRLPNMFKISFLPKSSLH